jgi:hypothetical protein
MAGTIAVQAGKDDGLALLAAPAKACGVVRVRA